MPPPNMPDLSNISKSTLSNISPEPRNVLRDLNGHDNSTTTLNLNKQFSSGQDDHPFPQNKYKKMQIQLS